MLIATTVKPATVRLRPGDTWQVIDTPVGELLVSGDEEALHHLLLPGSFDERKLAPAPEGRVLSTEAAREQIDAYFAHELREFSLPLDPSGTQFQRRVWFALADIPYGATESYSSIAARVGRPKACRAVGMASGRNPLPLVLACHRVIGSNGSLTGYGGGLELKQRLLDHERAGL
ncbi:MAG: methylated-DNA--[protein]-cysteine S-methyltransferase [Actinomycetota bacterium]|jgi:methylated-DNA-[protein]-cysteine S-methyltransferase|nr:methylated-DNA--[protein]-cysteine S-methyltransferase [Actinomycetota bacterium]